MSLLESIPGVGNIMNRWFAFPGDAGVMFVDNAFVTFKGLSAGTVEIKLPVGIYVSARKDVRIESNEGLEDPIKFITKGVTTHVTLMGSAGTWRKPTMPPIPGVPAVGGLVSGVGGVLSAVIGTSEFINKIDMLGDLYNKILVAADAPIEIEDTEGFLAGHEIHYVVPLDYNATPQLEEVAWVMRFVADKDDDPLELIFPEEE